MSSSTDITPRRSTRISSTPAHFHDEQASSIFQQQDENILQRALEKAEADYDFADASDEDMSLVEHDIAEEEEQRETQPVSDSIWTTDVHSIVTPRFTSSSGPQTQLSDPLALLQLFLPDSLLDLIASNTTAYALSKGATREWTTTREELYLFLAVNICMGICPYPQVHNVLE
jgi:hypothetical protein